MINFQKIKYLLIAIMGIFIFTQPAVAVRLYLDPAESNYQSGSTARLAMKIDTEGECINAIESAIRIPRGILEVKGISNGNSIFSLWVEEPNIDADAGLIHFIGGIPGGYCGSDDTNVNLDTILEFYVQPHTDMVDSFIVEIADDTQVLLHDGQGTPSKPTVQGALISFTHIGQEVIDEWQATIVQDIEPPDPFNIEIISDPSLYSGRYAAVFNTTDNQSGLDYYEVKETAEDGYSPNTKKPTSWQIATSPYLLRDQTLNSLIQIKAVDKAGNETISEYMPDGFEFKDKKQTFNRIILIFGVFLIFLLIIMLRLAFKHLHNHNHNK